MMSDCIKDGKIIPFNFFFVKCDEWVCFEVSFPRTSERTRLLLIEECEFIVDSSMVCFNVAFQCHFCSAF